MYTLYDIIDAEYAGGYKIIFTFENGVRKIYDFEGNLWGEAFEPLNNLALFRQFRVDKELGTIVWPNGADVAPDGMYERGKEI